MKVEAVDEAEDGIEKVGEGEEGREMGSGGEALDGEAVDGEGADAENGRLHDEQQAGVGQQAIERGEEQEDELDVVAEIMLDFDGAGEETAVGGVPNDLRFDGEVVEGGVEAIEAKDGVGGENGRPACNGKPKIERDAANGAR